MTNIYALTDPNFQASNPNYIRSIGKTDNPKRRLREHLSEAKIDKGNTNKNCWIKSLLKNNQKPILIILDNQIPLDNWESWERYYIALYRELGFNLTNTSDGGYANSFEKGHKVNLGKPQSKKQRENIRKGHLGLKYKPRTKPNKPMSDEGRENIRKGKLGMKYKKRVSSLFVE